MNRVALIAAHAHARSPFYATHWQGHDLADWRARPPVDKALMMAHFDEFNTRGIGREGAEGVALAAERSRDFSPTIGALTVGLSSGTSGHRGLFLVDPWESAASAGTILTRTLTPRPGPTGVAFFLRANSNLYEGLGGKLVRFRCFDPMAPLAESIAALNAFAPHFIVGPPSLLGLLAEAREAGELRVRPERLLAVAETLEPQDRARLAETFAAPVGQIYQCTEELLAISCARGALHVQEDLVALDYEPLPGAAGRVTPIVTDLWRRTQPMIRYRLNDVQRLDPAPCACGSPSQTIAAVEGQRDDLCHFLNPDGTPRPFFPDTIRRAILFADAPIADYRATQERPGHLHVALTTSSEAPFPPVAAAIRESMVATIAGYGCQPPDLTITEGIAPEEAGAKRRRVRRLG